MSMEANLKVNIISDSSPLEDLSNILENLIDLGSQVGDKISSSLSQVSEEATNVSSTLGEIDSTNIDDVSNSTENATQSMDNFTESIQQAGGETSGLKDSMDEAANSSTLFSKDTTNMITVSTKLGELSEKVGSLNDDFIAVNDTVGTVSANTGYSAEQVRQLATSYSEVGTSATDAATYLQRMQNAGLEPNSQAMNNAMNNAHLLQTAFRMTGSETDSMMGALARAGIGVDNLGSSFNALGYISSQTNIPIDTFSSVLTTSGANMQKYGINVDQAAVALSQINGRYRTARQAGAAFNQAVEESGGDVSKLEELLDLEAGSLSNASSETAKASGTVQDLSQSYVSAQGWTGTFNEKLDDLTMSLSGNLGSVSNFSAALSSCFSGASDMYSAIKIVKDVGKEAKLGYEGITGAVEAYKTAEEGAALASGLAAGVEAESTIVKGAATVAQWALNNAILSNPITWVVVAIIALIAILWYLYNTNESVRNIINTVWAVFKKLGSFLVGAFISHIQGVIGIFLKLYNGAKQVYNIIAGSLIGAWNRFKSSISQLLSPLSSVVSWLKQVYDWGSKAGEFISSWFGGGAAGGANLMTAQEKKYVANLSTLDYTPSNHEVMDKMSNNGGHTFNLTVEVGSVDNSDRVHEIVEAVRKELAWSNATAGRTV